MALFTEYTRSYLKAVLFARTKLNLENTTAELRSAGLDLEQAQNTVRIYIAELDRLRERLDKSTDDDNETTDDDKSINER
jgi:hypothetical protein